MSREEQAAQAVRALGQAVAAHRRAEERVRERAVDAVAAGVTVRRAAELAEVSPGTVQSWQRAAALALVTAGYGVGRAATATGARVETVIGWTGYTDDADDDEI